MYNRFSDLYDKLVFDIDYKLYAENIAKILLEKNISDASILEIGCGTGNLTQEISKISKDILAFDISEEMLNHAYNKLIYLENVNLIKYDMYKFPYEKYEFDAIVSLLDVINYIINPEKIKELFYKIYQGLRDGGVFIFDINSKYKLLEVLGNNHFVFEKDNIFYTWESSLEGNLVHFELNFFVKVNNLYERIEEKQIERYYSIDFIINLLEEVGYKEIKFVDEDGGEFVEGKTQRILFSAMK